MDGNTDVRRHNAAGGITSDILAEARRWKLSAIRRVCNLSGTAALGGSAAAAGAAKPRPRCGPAG